MNYVLFGMIYVLAIIVFIRVCWAHRQILSWPWAVAFFLYYYLQFSFNVFGRMTGYHPPSGLWGVLIGWGFYSLAPWGVLVTAIVIRYQRAGGVEKNLGKITAEALLLLPVVLIITVMMFQLSILLFYPRYDYMG